MTAPWKPQTRPSAQTRRVRSLIIRLWLGFCGTMVFVLPLTAFSASAMQVRIEDRKRDDAIRAAAIEALVEIEMERLKATHASQSAPHGIEDLPTEPNPPMLIGMYTSSSLQTSAWELAHLDRWLEDHGLASRLSIAGTFMDIEFPYPMGNITRDLDAAWDLGYTPFVNLAVGTTDLGPRSAYAVASGKLDEAIHTWAKVYADWSSNGGKVAFIAPLQEMNGYWTSYGLDPENYKKAYRRIRSIFTSEGVGHEAAIWVFAPNGWSQVGHEFERYYPGDDTVDALGLSAFNFGACANPVDGWATFESAILPYLKRMRDLAPSKPVFLAQTGTVAEGGDEDDWLLESFQGMVDSGLRGVIYFNVAKPEAGAPACEIVDWRVYDPESGSGRRGFLEAIAALERLPPSGGSAQRFGSLMDDPALQRVFQRAVE